MLGAICHRSHDNCRLGGLTDASVSLTGTVVTYSAPAVATKRHLCQASSCSSPAVCARAATATSRSARLLSTWSWRRPSPPAPTEDHPTRTQESWAELAAAGARSYAQCPLCFDWLCAAEMQFKVNVEEMVCSLRILKGWVSDRWAAVMELHSTDRGARWAGTQRRRPHCLCSSHVSSHDKGLCGLCAPPPHTHMFISTHWGPSCLLGALMFL